MVRGHEGQPGRAGGPLWRQSTARQLAAGPLHQAGGHLIPIIGGEELEPGYVRLKAGCDPLMDAGTLYDATRGWWRVSPTSFAGRGVEHVVAVAGGVTRALYEVDKWIGPRNDGRFAFGGRIVTKRPTCDEGGYDQADSQGQGVSRG